MQVSVRTGLKRVGWTYLCYDVGATDASDPPEIGADPEGDIVYAGVPGTDIVYAGVPGTAAIGSGERGSD